MATETTLYPALKHEKDEERKLEEQRLRHQEPPQISTISTPQAAERFPVENITSQTPSSPVGYWEDMKSRGDAAMSVLAPYQQETPESSFLREIGGMRERG